MRITSGKVVLGKVVVEDETLPEGATVTIVAPDESEEFELGSAEEALLLEAIEQAEHGRTLSASEVLSQLKARS